MAINSSISGMNENASQEITSTNLGPKDGKYPSPRIGRKMSGRMDLDILIENSKKEQTALAAALNSRIPQTASAAGLAGRFNARPTSKS